MSFGGIALYCLRAGSFAAAVYAAYALFCCARGRRVRLKRLLGIGYIAALVQITVLRGGVDWNAVMASGRTAQLVPLRTTMGLLNGGLWNLIYNIVGNLIWFVPLGMLLGRGRLVRALALGAGTSVCIELLQFLLRTGVTDVDDIILNALGAAIGWGVMRIWRKRA